MEARDMGGCQNYCPLLGTRNTRCRTMTGTPKGTIILTISHMEGPKRPHEHKDPTNHGFLETPIWSGDVRKVSRSRNML